MTAAAAAAAVTAAVPMRNFFILLCAWYFLTSVQSCKTLLIRGVYWYWYVSGVYVRINIIAFVLRLLAA